MTPDEEARWHAWRSDPAVVPITASEIAGAASGAFGSSPYVVAARRLGIVGPVEETEAMRWGHRLEPRIIAAFEELTGCHVIARQAWCEQAEHPWRRATIDGLVIPPDDPPIADNADAVFEGKTTEHRYPRDYVDAQVQWQMLVTGLPRAQVVTAHHRDGRVGRLTLDEHVADTDMQAELVGLADRIRDMIRAGRPEPDGWEATTDAIRARWPAEDAVDTGVELTDELVRNIGADLPIIQRRLADLEEREREIKQKIMDHLGAATIGVVGGQTWVSWRPQTSRRVDTKALRADQPELAAKYERVTSTRVLRFHSQ